MPAVAYTPRDPTASVLYTVVREHIETFRVEAARLRDGQGLPRFVDAEFDAFLRCGFLAGGFARFRCDACRTERLVAFSCKGRGFWRADAIGPGGHGSLSRILSHPHLKVGDSMRRVG